MNGKRISRVCAFGVVVGIIVSLSAACAFGAERKERCQAMRLEDGSVVFAAPTKTGWSTTACESQVTIRLTNRLAKGKVFEVKSFSAFKCTVHVSLKGFSKDVLLRAFQACSDATLNEAEKLAANVDVNAEIKE